ncbi:MAG: cytidine deaminase [candidate division WOR-3 bacterium]
MNFEDIFQEVVKNLQNSYAPYSRFLVSSCAIMENGEGDVKRFFGVNVENSSYGLTVCAERVAIFKGVSEGYRKLLAVVLVASFKGELVEVYPCGACRQVMWEFGEGDTEVYNGFKRVKLGELLPFGFRLRRKG